MAKSEKEKTSVNTSSWMTTYADLMTLLLTFFVLLTSISVTDHKRKRLALNSLVGAFGFKPGGQAIIGSRKGTNITMGDAPMVEEEIQFEKLRNVALKSSLESEAEVIKEQDRTVISLSNRVLFGRGSSQIKPDSRQFLLDLARVLKEGSPNLIELRGYIDPSEVTFGTDPLRAAIYLSSRRAFSVFRYLMQKGDIPAKIMVAHGFGANSEERRRPKRSTVFNRQVDIIVDYREKIPYRLRRPESKGSFLDFKGFLFRIPGRENE